MAIAFKCDRCKEYSDKGFAVCTVNAWENNPKVVYRSLSVCENCFNDITNTINTIVKSRPKSYHDR